MENQIPENNNVFEETPIAETSDNDTIKVSQEEIINAVQEPTKTFGIISLVCGILSLFTSCCCCGIFSLPLSIAAVVLAVVDKSKNGKFSGLAIGGLVLGILGVVFYVLSFLLNISSSFMDIMMAEL